MPGRRSVDTGRRGRSVGRPCDTFYWSPWQTDSGILTETDTRPASDRWPWAGRYAVTWRRRTFVMHRLQTIERIPRAELGGAQWWPRGAQQGGDHLTKGLTLRRCSISSQIFVDWCKLLLLKHVFLTGWFAWMLFKKIKLKAIRTLK